MIVDFQAFLGTLPIMGKGMFGIFSVTAIIILSIYLMNKLTNIKFKKKDKEPKEDK
ncbi:MAG: hypothetical protein RR552_02105 [Oscillospiraceae bacterium]